VAEDHGVDAAFVVVVAAVLEVCKIIEVLGDVEHHCGEISSVDKPLK